MGSYYKYKSYEDRKRAQGDAALMAMIMYVFYIAICLITFTAIFGWKILKRIAMEIKELIIEIELRKNRAKNSEKYIFSEYRN